MAIEWTGSSQGRRGRQLLVVAVLALALLAVAPFVAFSALALASPYASVEVPASCAQALAPIPAGASIDIPGQGHGVRLALAGDRAVAVAMGATPSPHPLAVYLLDRSASRILWQAPLGSDAVVAAIDAGIVFLWDDKIGYAVSAATGELLGALVRSDNYRGVFEANGTRRLQLDAEVTSVGLRGDILAYRTFRLAGVVGGCMFGLAGSWAPARRVGPVAIQSRALAQPSTPSDAADARDSVWSSPRRRRPRASPRQARETGGP